MMENKYGVRILIEILRNVNNKNDKKRLVKLLRYYIRSRKGSVFVPGLVDIINDCHMNKTDNADEFYDKVFERVDKIKFYPSFDDSNKIPTECFQEV